MKQKVSRKNSPFHIPFQLIMLIATGALANQPAWAQETKPADSTPSKRVPSITVTEQGLSLHDVASESERVGPANQPEWTTRRAFAETDIYVIPEGEIEFNQFYELSHPRHGKPEHEFESEFEFGLPWRTQFDVEPIYSVEDGKLEYNSTRLELPHALADWGKLPLNPTIDGGWRFRNHEADSFLVRLLLAEELGERWHLGANLGYEQQVGGDREKEYELNAALTYIVKDRKLTVGAELLVEHETANDEASSTAVMLGPMLLYKPTPRTHLGFVPLFGITSDSPVAELFFIFGIDFEPFRWRWAKEEQRGFQPVRRPR